MFCFVVCTGIYLCCGNICVAEIIFNINSVYKQAGNGVTVNVIEAIGRRIAAMDAELRDEALAP